MGKREQSQLGKPQALLPKARVWFGLDLSCHDSSGAWRPLGNVSHHILSLHRLYLF